MQFENIILYTEIWYTQDIMKYVLGTLLHGG